MPTQISEDFDGLASETKLFATVSRLKGLGFRIPVLSLRFPFGVLRFEA
jgi:hypothetical protein